jgi:hypothetical protein
VDLTVIHSSSIDRVRDATDIVSLVGEYIALRKSGVHHQGLCPFHKDKKTPSLSVDENKGLWHCFGCQKGGNALQWLQEIEGIPFPDALQRLADRAGISLDKQPWQAPQHQGDRQKEGRDATYTWRHVRYRLTVLLREIDRWDRQACRKFGDQWLSGEELTPWEEFVVEFPHVLRLILESQIKMIDSATPQQLLRAFKELPSSTRDRMRSLREEDDRLNKLIEAGMGTY